MAKITDHVDFCPGDWMRDPAVRTCGLAARGLWFDMLCLMWEGPARGYLQHGNGQPVTPAQLARAVGAAAEQIEELLAELESADVFSRTDEEIIFSRRIVRDEVLRQEQAATGGKKAAKRTPSGPATDAVAIPAQPRPRDELFDAVAEVSGRDPGSAGALIGTAVKRLRSAKPPFTPEEVREFGRRFWELCPWAVEDNRVRPTPTEIPSHIGQLRARPAPVQNQPKPALVDQIADNGAEFLRRTSGMKRD